MRALLLGVFILLVATSTSDARGSRKTKKAVAIATSAEKRKVVEKKQPKARGQSIGAPWSGKLARSTKFRAPGRTHVRRPHRAFGTRTTVDHVRRAIMKTLEQFPKLHTLAIGDFSASRGGRISEHSSHQSGRDVDLGLFYKQRPAGYPASFIEADEDTLHEAAMWSLIVNLERTHDEDGGVHIMFLDFHLQGVIYEWARDNGVPERRLNRIFQYPHGLGAAAGLIRHEPNHGDHLHVRFRCAAADAGCR